MAERREPAETFGDWLRQIRAGELEEELMGELRALAAEVEQRGKSGTLTLTLTLSSSERGRILVDDKVNRKPPNPVNESTLFFLTPGGALSRRDPRQLRLKDLDVDREPRGSARTEDDDRDERGIR